MVRVTLGIAVTVIGIDQHRERRSVNDLSQQRRFFAETFKWKEGLDKSFKGARPFYTVLIFSTLVGIAMDFLNINSVKALFWTAVINGLLAPFLLVGILFVACDRKLMQDQPSSMLSRVVVVITTIAMFAAAIGMFVL